ncbi:LysR family transcriptional regulator [Ensifer sp. LBL]|uniref:LysR family transcriptional regulator n=1 Tax=Ensifer sp. LBL TaxID=2991056 RepID=UPI003D192319
MDTTQGRVSTTVSEALQRLEEQLGCQLALRGSRKFELTAPGQKVFEECSCHGRLQPRSPVPLAPSQSGNK